MSSSASDPYTGLLAKHGPTAQGCGWADTRTQHRRFEVLLDLYRLAPHLGRGLLDVGCGVGDLAPLAFKRELFYLGIDRNLHMVMAAQRKYPGHEFRHQAVEDMTEDAGYDVVVASGLFAYAEAPEFERAISRMLAMARQAIAVNCLSTWADRARPDDETLFEPFNTLSIARRLAAPWPRVVLRHDYHPGDFTIYVFKDT